MHNAVHSANEYCKKWDIPIVRPRRKRLMPGETARDSGLTAQQERNAVIVDIVNRLKTEIKDRSIRLQNLTDRLLFILSLSSIDIAHEQEREKLRKDCLDFANYYVKAVTAIQLYDDIIVFVMLLRARGNAVPFNLSMLVNV